MSCKDCENKQNEISLNGMKNYTIEELQKAYEIGNKPSYSGDEVAWFYNLYNRVFGTNQQPGCGKCFVNVRKNLTRRYEAERNN